jgi:peptide/nickel transport system substrate-binding protein
MAELPSGTVTFLFTDVEGSTRLLKQIGESYGEVLADHQRLLREAFERFGGQEIDTQGDSFFVAFSRARDAAAAAVEAQRALATHGWPEGVRFRVRMGVHTAEPAVQPDRYVGLGVHRAARIMAAGHGGQILLSNTTRELIEDDLPPDVSLQDLGEHRLKDLDRPERLFQLDAQGLPSDFAPLRTEEAPTAYTGREDELAKAAGAAIIRPPYLRRRSLLVAMLAGVVAAAVAIPVFAIGGNGSDGGGSASGDPDTAIAIDAESGRVGASVPVGSGPVRAALGEDAVWVANSDGTVSRIDPARNVAVQTVRAGSGLAGIAVGNDAVWVADGLEGKLVRISDDRVVQTTPLPRGPRGVAFGEKAVWVANLDDHSVTRVDAVTGEVVRTIPTGGTPTAIAVGEGSVWVTNETGASVFRIDPGMNAVAQTINVGNGPSAIAVGEGSVWVTNTLDDTLTRIDPATGTVTGLVRVGAGPRAVGVAAGSVWVANELGGTVSRIDPQTTRVRGRVSTGNRPSGIAAGEETVWVTVRAGGGVHRGGTLRFATALTVDSIDPAVAYDVTTWQILSLTADGLTAFRRVGGPEGAAIVPDLATALPTPTNAGRTYRFQLRHGIRYSTGALVEPRDVRASIERVFELRSPGTPYYEGIVGASACATGRRCDLSRGIVVDGPARAITFHLTQPDPEFLFKLALTFAYVVPARTPSRETGTHPLPATGPYVITSYKPKRSVKLVRNPHFREWSGAARPEGYADEILITNASPAQALNAVRGGRADLGADLPPEQIDTIATRYPSRLRSTPSGETDFLSLNTRIPPFSNLDARRAVNYAVDRRAVLDLFGGSQYARPTCQALPPNFPGYEAYCPYTQGAPDLGKARQLIARSGTAGMRVELVGADVRPYDALARHMAGVLERLGYRVSTKLLPFEEWAVAVGDRHSNTEAAMGAWRPDYPSPSGVIVPLFSCARQGLMAFCRRGIDTQMRRAQSLQLTDPRAANALWARIEREIVDQAPLVGLVNLKDVEFVSERLGNYQYHPMFSTLLDQLWVR